MYQWQCSYQNFTGDTDPGYNHRDHEKNLDIPCDNSGSKWSQYVEEAHEDSTTDPQPGEDLYTTDGNQFYGSRKRKRDNGSSYDRKGQRYQNHDSDVSSKRTWKGQKENLHYGYTDYDTCNTQPNPNFSQPESFTSDSNNHVPRTKPSLQSIATFDEKHLFTISGIDSVAGYEKYKALEIIDQNRISSAKVTDSVSKTKNTPKTKSYSVSKNREITGSKWDRFLPEGSDEDLEDSDSTSAESPHVVQTLSTESARLQSKVHETGREITSSKYENYKSVTVTGTGTGMFFIGDLEDSDFDI